MIISSIDAPIERGKQKGNPSAYVHFGVDISAKQQRILNLLPNPGIEIIVPRNAVSMRDLSV
jgi:hypothetical protein